MSASSTDLSNAFKTVRLAWEDTEATWKDAVRRDFEADTWTPLEAHVRSVLGAMDRLGPVLAKAVRDCS